MAKHFMMRDPVLPSRAYVRWGREGRFEIMYWSLWKRRWTSTGPFGRTILSIPPPLRFIAHEDIFWVMA